MTNKKGSGRDQWPRLDSRARREIGRLGDDAVQSVDVSDESPPAVDRAERREIDHARQVVPSSEGKDGREIADGVVDLGAALEEREGPALDVRLREIRREADRNDAGVVWASHEAWQAAEREHDAADDLGVGRSNS